MSDLQDKLNETVSFVRQRTPLVPEIGIILGTGLGGLVNEIDVECTIDYSEIPHFPLSTVEFHAGRLIFGTLGGKRIVAMQGRMHYYEGYSLDRVVYPVRVMKFLGAGILIVSNACGSVNPEIKKGNIMLIDDHINLLGTNPLIGPNDENLGPRFPDMSEPYSKRLSDIAFGLASLHNIELYKGVFAAMTGPTLETRAEYRMLRIIGADAVGMSTVPEVIAARHMGMEVLGLSIITDEGDPDNLKPVDISEIINTANIAEPKLTLLIRKIAEKL